ncbi:peptide-methionine (S)-S-oxide reductase MsrA [Thermodesulfobacteriota bacterium]
MKYLYTLVLLAGLAVVACGSGQAQKDVRMQKTTEGKEPAAARQPGRETATFGAGCFWCVEAVFQALDGVSEVVSGYSGGSVPDPTYEQVCAGTTGHAEACRITFDPARITYTELLEVFWQTHDPTTLNRQGADVGTQYRSVIFYHSAEQKQLAEQYRARLDQSGSWKDSLVTEISPAAVFYPAEDYHQDYYSQNADQPYCRFVIVPKLEKFRSVFKDKLKK